MKKFNFWFPNSKRVVMQQFSKENPFSGMNGSLTQAESWAYNLLTVNSDESEVNYMVEHERKIYTAYKWLAQGIEFFCTC